MVVRPPPQHFCSQLTNATAEHPRLSPLGSQQDLPNVRSPSSVKKTKFPCCS
ncbi:hypothetical protein KIN20_005621 [Parelaphostrongylus tenuis]|uniref:Uncharacterized protein n=1 Tax=Parelaphostrongylus tenuis TaxID=148309 RepID=A0AAD5M4U3_PARTN|nr:hypothetical protein KIN20_005621 [Parelaphostrongylus tenuis]